MGVGSGYPLATRAEGDFLLGTTVAGSVRRFADSIGVSAQTGTTFAFVTDNNKSLVTFDNAAAIAATLSPANNTTFRNGWYVKVRNLGAGTVTITPTTSTIDGAATFVLHSGTSAVIESDGVNYWVFAHSSKHQERNVNEFGADDTGVADSTAAIAAAHAWYAAAGPGSQRRSLVFTAGIYKFSSWPDFARDHASVLARGEVRLRYTGTGTAMAFGTASDTWNFTFGGPSPFIIECPSTAIDAVTVRMCHHSTFHLNIRGCGTGDSALIVNDCVCSIFYYTCSVNEGGWYGAAPANGLLIDSLVASATSYCTFINPIIEGPAYGINIAKGLGNLFLSGTSEACTNTGLLCGAAAHDNKFFGTDFEVNTTYDVDFASGSRGNKLVGCDTYGSVRIHGDMNQIDGGEHSDITVSAGATNTRLRNLTYNRFNDGSLLTDSGTNTRRHDVYNFGTGVLTDDSREVLKAARAYYVRTDGSNSNTGLANTAGGAFLTVQKAIDVAATIDLAGFNLTIQIADGTYTGTNTLKEIVGYSAPGCLVIQGNNATPANVVIGVVSSNAAFNATAIQSVWDIKDLKTVGSSLAANLGSVVRFGNLDIGAGTAGVDIFLSTDQGGKIAALSNFAVSGGCYALWYASNQGLISANGRTITFSNSPAFNYTAFATQQAMLNVYSMTFTNGGTVTGTRYYVDTQSQIATQAGGASYIPGNVGGTADTGTYGLYQ